VLVFLIFFVLGAMVGFFVFKAVASLVEELRDHILLLLGESFKANWRGEEEYRELFRQGSPKP